MIYAANTEIVRFFTFLTEYLGIRNAWSFLRILIDIAIVSFVIYKGVQMLKETRALQLIKGIVLFLVISVIANFIGLTTVSYLMEYALQILPFVVIIAFQSEIRIALEGIGKSKFKDLFKPKGAIETKETEHMINEVVLAVEALVRNKYGALIVFEKETNLGEIIRTGVVIDSLVSSQLLQLIFVPSTPLHDGAVVIRDNKIYAAACVLPLSGNLHISKELGTRHRAGIGITESSDSLSVVVSEESHTVSIARRGTLIRNITANNLRTILTNEFIKKDEKKRKELKEYLPFWKERKK